MILKDKVIIVTGATRGIGKAILTRMAQEGAIVYGIYASNDLLANEITNNLKKQDLVVTYCKGSVSDREFIKNTFQTIYNKHGKIDVLVNNAGIARDNFITQMSESDWDSVLNINYLGTYICCTEVIKYMEPAKQGKVVNMISVTGVMGREAQSNYGTSKGAIIGLTRLLSRKYNEKGLYFNCIAPGLIDTEMIQELAQEKISGFLQYTNSKRVGLVQEIANSAVFLASELSNYVSDVVLKVDGGFSR